MPGTGPPSGGPISGGPPSGTPPGQNLATFKLGSVGNPCCSCSGGGGGLKCLPCTIPTTNLTISWLNFLTGNGSATMTYNVGSANWTANCVDGLKFLLQCSLSGGGQIELQAIYQLTGICPGGTTDDCTNLRVLPHKLTFASHTCTPFVLTFTVSGADCPNVSAAGNTQFTVTL